MTTPERNAAPLISEQPVDHPPRDMFPAYATSAALGAAPQADLAAHLASCPTCRVELDELAELTRVAYIGQIEPSHDYPQPDLSFLGQPQSRPADQPSLLDDLGRLIIVFTEALLTTLHKPSLAGAARGELMYRYVQEPGPLRVTIEVYAESEASMTGRVQVNVDIDSRDPFEQQGTQVVLRAGEEAWQGQTDQTGYVDFTPVPLSSLPGLRVEVTPS
jgi:hypothetical protein